MKNGGKIMLTIKIDIQDHLINGQVGEVTHIDITRNIFRKVYVKFPDLQAGLKAMTASHFSRQHSWVVIKKSETEIPIIKKLDIYTNQENSISFRSSMGI